MKDKPLNRNEHYYDHYWKNTPSKGEDKTDKEEE
jgi:hypothetical protein